MRLAAILGILLTASCGGAPFAAQDPSEPTDSGRGDAAEDAGDAGAGEAAVDAATADFFVCRLTEAGSVTHFYVCGTGWETYVAAAKAGTWSAAVWHTPSDPNADPYVVSVGNPGVGVPVTATCPSSSVGPAPARCPSPLFMANSQACTVGWADGGAFDPQWSNGWGYCSSP